jgi:predicted RND superfamily exporter protein/lauroyl/myristoyl acyltransferase
MNRRRWLWLLCLLPVGAGLARLQFDTEVLHLLPGDVPEVRGLKLWQEHFGDSRDLLITVRAADADAAGQRAREIAEALRSEKGLTGDVFWQSPWRDHPVEAAEITAAAWLNSPPADVAKLAARLQPASLEQELRQLREQLATSFSPGDIGRLGYDPLRLMEVPALRKSLSADFVGDGPPFASADGTLRAIQVQTPELFSDYRAAARWLDRVKDRLRVASSGNGDLHLADVRFTGGPVFLAEIAADMERDMKRSVTGTAMVVALLFWAVHRRLKPLLWLVTLLGFVLLATMAAGGLFFGRLNVVSMGFAAILLGLAVDYGLVVYQERRVHRDLPLQTVLRSTGPGIWWSAITTAGAFVLLNFGGLPGLAQLGSLVATGIMIAAAVMLGWFLGPLEAGGGQSPREESEVSAATPTPPRTKRSGRHGWSSIVLVLSLLVGGVAAFLVMRHPPVVDATSEALRPANSPAYEAMDEFRQAMGGTERWALLVSGADEQVVADELQSVDAKLSRLVSDGAIQSVLSPGVLWPNPRNQRDNRKVIRDVVDRWQALAALTQGAGFTEGSVGFAEGVMAAWRRALDTTQTFWPTNRASRWILREMSAQDAGLLVAACAITPSHGSAADAIRSVQSRNVFLASWERLGPALLENVETRLNWVLAGIIAVVLASLALTFRNLTEVVLSLMNLLFGGLVLLAVMSVAHWSWNLMNLMAVPLLLGSTVDYSIHMQLSLRRHRGDVQATFEATGKAILLCAATTAAGFGSLAYSSNTGLASLGRICAVGALSAAVVACFLLPTWWRLSRREAAAGDAGEAVTGVAAPPRHDPNDRPSRLYGYTAWKVGMAIAWLLPTSVARTLAGFCARLYGGLARARRRVVIENLLPVYGGDRRAAAGAAHRLFRHFGIKIADLLRYESGRPVDALFRQLPSPDRFTAPGPHGCGTLLLTIHLGNWEFGAPLLRQIGVQLLVITLAEPGGEFTRLRERARQRWGVETLVIGQDAFAFVEVLKRLQEGAVIALLIDRPPASGAVNVELFGRPFAASIAAAELARASGCRLMPVAIPWTPAGYDVVGLPVIEYDRSRLGDRESRRQLAQEIVRAFEPVIRQHADQWFHFVPVWK